MSEKDKTDILEEISRSIYELEGLDKVKEIVENALKQGHSVTEVVERGLRKGLDEVGRRYERKEYFLSELLYAGETMKGLLEVLKPHIKHDEMKQIGTIVLGTVRGDMHDIGKNIFGMLVQFSGFRVHDLGVDVGPKTFVNEVRDTGANILGLSTLLTSTLPEVKVVLDELSAAGIRDNVKVILGGNAVSKEFAREVGADDAALDAVEGAEICKNWVAAR